MRMKWILIPLSAVVLLPVLLLVVVLVFLNSSDLSQHRDVIAEQVSKMAGRRLSLDGELDLNLSMTPSIVVTRIALANAPWASEPEMLTIQHVEAEVELLPLLHGDIHILRFHLKDVKALLETNADGLGNWVLAEPGDDDVDAGDVGKAGGLKLPWLGDVFIGDVEFSYLDGQSGQSVIAQLDHARVSTARLDSPTVFDIVGQVNNNPVEINGNLALPAVFATASMDIPIELHATVLDLKADATGTISGAAESPAIDLSVQANAANLKQLRQVFGDVVPEVQAVKLAMEVKGDQGQPVSFTLNAVAGKGKLDTQLTLRRDGPRPNLTGSVDISDIDVVRLWAPLLAVKPADSSATKAQTPPSTSSHQFDQPIALDWLEGFDANIVLSANNINLPQARITGLQSRFIVDDRSLKLDELKLSTDAGSVMVGMLLNARGKQPNIQLDLNTTVIALGKLQPLAGNKRLANSSAKAVIALVAQGGPVAGLIESMQGSVQLDYSDQKHKEELTIKLTRKPESEAAAKTSLVVAASGRIDGQAIKLSGNIIPPKGLIAWNKPYEINLAIQAYGISTTVTGTVADIYTLNGLDLGIEAHAADLAGLRKAFGKNVPTVGKTDLSTRLTLQQSKLRLSKFQLGLGDGRIDGWLQLDTADSLPDLQADLTFTDLDLDKLLPAADQTASAKAKPAAKSSDDRIFSTEPLPFGQLSRANISAMLQANNVVHNKRRLKEVAVRIELAQGKLAASLLKAASAKGELVGEFIVDAGAGATPEVTIKLKAPRFELAELFAAEGSTATVEGPLAADILLQGQGNSMAQLMATLNGHVSLLAEHGSADASMLEALDKFVGGLSAMFGSIFTEQSSKTKINCAICDMKIQNGVMTTQLAVLDTQYSTVFAEGQVDLGKEQLDIKVSPEAKGVTLSVAVPVRLHGRLSKPGIEIEKTGALIKTGELWATVAYPPAALVKFSDLGGGKQNPCVSMVAEKSSFPFVKDIGKAVGGAVKGVGGAVKDAGSGVGGAVKDVGSGVGGAVKGVGSGIGKIFGKGEEDGESTTATENDDEDEDEDEDLFGMD